MLTLQELKELGATLHAARRERTHYCTELREPPEGAEDVDLAAGTCTVWQVVSNPAKARQRNNEVRRRGDGQFEKKIEGHPIGEHGSAFLGIDPATGTVGCIACQE